MENSTVVTTKKKRGGRRRPLKPIESSRIRKATFLKRRGGLMKKAMELQTLCDVPTLVICFSADTTDVRQQVLQTWPEDQNEVLGLVARYAGISQYERSRWRKDTETLMKAQIDKNTSEIQRIREECKGLLDAKIEAIDRRISYLLDQESSTVNNNSQLSDQDDDDNNNNNNNILVPYESSPLLMDLCNNNKHCYSDDYDYDMLTRSLCDENNCLFKDDDFPISYDTQQQMVVYDNSNMFDDDIFGCFDQQQLPIGIYDDDDDNNMFTGSDEVNPYVCNGNPIF